ncbi:MAG: glycosyltransferase family 1 protein [Candidatus Saccharibacteria bacterium]|nr:glycosyltransferase family 1 protein [Candidatus Saccharibacteria bacterium]
MQNPTAKKINVFVDGEVLCLDHFSGIGHYTASLLKEIDTLLEDKKYEHFNVTIGAPWRLVHRLERFGFKNITSKKMPFGPHIANGLKRYGLLPPIDLFFGKQIYVFPHFSSWPTIMSPSVPIIYDLSFVLYPEFSEERNRSLLVKQSALSAKRANRIITISTNSKKEIADEYAYDVEKIDILYPIISRAEFYPRSKTEIRTVKAKYGIFEEYLLYVGNIEPRKNLVTLLKAYDGLDSNLQKKYPLLLVGAKGWKDDEIHTTIASMQARGLKVIQPNDYVGDEDMPALISGATVFAYVSKYEGFGIPPVEAMFCGTPVVSSDNSSLPEATGNAGMMVNADSPKAITKALKSLLSDESMRREYRDKGLKHSHNSMFKVGSNAEKFFDLITNIEIGKS